MLVAISCYEVRYYSILPCIFQIIRTSSRHSLRGRTFRLRFYSNFTRTSLIDLIPGRRRFLLVHIDGASVTIGSDSRNCITSFFLHLFATCFLFATNGGSNALHYFLLVSRSDVGGFIQVNEMFDGIGLYESTVVNYSKRQEMEGIIERRLF